MPSIADKRLLRKKNDLHSLSSFQKTESTQTFESKIAESIELVKKTKLELQLIEIVDCFLHYQSIYDSNLKSFRKNFWTSLFLQCEEIEKHEVAVWTT